MASPNIYAGGLNLAGTVFANGPTTLQRGGPVYFSGGIQWVDTISGDNSNAGTLPELPVATLAQAITNHGANDNRTIIIGAGSSEDVGTARTISQAGWSIFGCGTGSSRPRYTSTAAITMFDITGAGTLIEGFYFPAATTAAPTSRVGITGAGCHVIDCYFECGALDTNRALRLHTGSTNTQVNGCSFVTTASRPAIGLEISAAINDADITDCVFSGGSYGWSDYALKVSAAATRVRIFGGTYTNHSDIGFTVTATSYQLFGPEMDGTSNVLLTA